MPTQEPSDDLLDPTPPSLADLNVDSYFKSCAETDPLHVEQSFIRLPAEFAYWAELQNRAFNLFGRAHLNMKRVAARLAVECREILEAQKGKATESMVRFDAPSQAEIASISVCGAPNRAPYSSGVSHLWKFGEVGSCCCARN